MNAIHEVLARLADGIPVPGPWWVVVFLLLPLVDGQNALAYIRRPIALARPDEADDDYTFIIPLYGHPRYFAAQERMEPFKPRVILSVNIDEPVMAEAADRWEAEGWRVVRTVIDNRLAPNELIEAALPSVTTTYAIRLDGDSVPRDDPGRAIAALKAHGIECASVLVVPSRTDRLAERMQALEYGVAMRTRSYRPWLTSGACMILRTDLYREVQLRHSNFFLGEDIEVGRIALWLGARCGHVALEVETDVPPTFRALFRQRRGWWCGSFRLSVVNIDRNLQVPGFFLYSSVFIWLLLPFKLAALALAPQVVPVLMLEYMLLTLAVNWPQRSRYMVLLPYYALVQALVLPFFGVARWVSLSRSSGRYGRLTIGARPCRAPQAASTAVPVADARLSEA